MSKGKRKRYAAEFKAKVALEAMKDLYDNAMIAGCASWLDSHNNKAYLAGQISVTNNGISIYYAAKNKFPKIAEDTFHQYPPQGKMGPTELHQKNRVRRQPR